MILVHLCVTSSAPKKIAGWNEHNWLEKRATIFVQQVLLKHVDKFGGYEPI